MPANSLPRRVAKKLLTPVLGERSYSVLQAIAMAWDIRSGSWSEPELEIIPHAVREGDTVLDIGANYGLYAHHLWPAVGRTGKVYCFEPIPFTARTFRLVGRLLGFKNVELVDKGCSEKTGRIAFELPLLETGRISAGLVHRAGRNDDRPGREVHARFSKTRRIECDVVSIDEFLPELSNLSLVKCDIEGADLFALRGARKTLEKHRPTVICEITPWFLEGFGLEIADLVGFFEELGYRLYKYEDGKLIPTATEDVVEDNWVFVHPSRRDRLAKLLPAEG
jgi:FkbM family methyltransferase